RPLPLIYAKGAADLGMDYDFNFVRRYVHKTAPRAMSELSNLGHLLWKAPRSDLELLVAMIEARLGIGRDASEKLLRLVAGTSTGELGLRTWIDPKKVDKEMATDIEPWQLLLPQKLIDEVGQTSPSKINQT